MGIWVKITIITTTIIITKGRKEGEGGKKES
jgi:hypothetical protein